MINIDLCLVNTGKFNFWARNNNTWYRFFPDLSHFMDMIQLPT